MPVFAIGHGAAAEWDKSSDPPTYVQTSFLPTHVVPDVAFEVPGNKAVLDLHRLARINSCSVEIIAELDEFVDGYQRWIVQTGEAVRSRVDPRLANAADRLINRMVGAEGRMRKGVRLLAERPKIRQAFGMANLAMLMQMVHSGPELAGIPTCPVEGAPGCHAHLPVVRVLLAALSAGVPPAYLGGHGGGQCRPRLWWTSSGSPQVVARRRPISASPHSPSSTGGSVTVVTGAGTTVITRYTLRLLTAQQFQRAATMILPWRSFGKTVPTYSGVDR